MGSSAISGRQMLSDFLEAVEIGAVARVIDAPALVFQHKPAVAAMMVAQHARAPVFAGREGHLPVALAEALPPIQFDDAPEAEVVGQIADAPRHDADFRMRQPAQRGLVEMIEMRVGQQHQVNRRQVLDLQAGALDALEQEQPVREVRIDQHVQVGELDQERGVADPGDGDLAEGQLGKGRALGSGRCAG